MASSFDIIGISYACGEGYQGATVEHLFGVGSYAYSIKKAQQGYFEKIAIKYVNVLVEHNGLGNPPILYVDTFNTLWNESELCTYNTANNYVYNYWNNVKSDILNSLQDCGYLS